MKDVVECKFVISAEERERERREREGKYERRKSRIMRREMEAKRVTKNERWRGKF